MTPLQQDALVNVLEDICNDVSRLHTSLDRLIDVFQTDGEELQKRKAMRNREDAIDELLRKEGLWW